MWKSIGLLPLILLSWLVMFSASILPVQALSRQSPLWGIVGGAQPTSLPSTVRGQKKKKKVKKRKHRSKEPESRRKVSSIEQSDALPSVDNARPITSKHTKKKKKRRKKTHRRPVSKLKGETSKASLQSEPRIAEDERPKTKRKKKVKKHKKKKKIKLHIPAALVEPVDEIKTVDQASTIRKHKKKKIKKKKKVKHRRVEAADQVTVDDTKAEELDATQIADQHPVKEPPKTPEPEDMVSQAVEAAESHALASLDRVHQMEGYMHIKSDNDNITSSTSHVHVTTHHTELHHEADPGADGFSFGTYNTSKRETDLEDYMHIKADQRAEDPTEYAATHPHTLDPAASHAVEGEPDYSQPDRKHVLEEYVHIDVGEDKAKSAETSMETEESSEDETEDVRESIDLESEVDIAKATTDGSTESTAAETESGDASSDEVETDKEQVESVIPQLRTSLFSNSPVEDESPNDRDVSMPTGERGEMKGEDTDETEDSTTKSSGEDKVEDHESEQVPEATQITDDTSSKTEASNEKMSSASGSFDSTPEDGDEIASGSNEYESSEVTKADANNVMSSESKELEEPSESDDESDDDSESDDGSTESGDDKPGSADQEEVGQESHSQSAAKDISAETPSSVEAAEAEAPPPESAFLGTAEESAPLNVPEQETESHIGDEARQLAESEKRVKAPSKIDLDTLAQSEDDPSDILVSVVTWNLAEESPSEEDARFIRKFRKVGEQGSDLVVISGQECENIKPRRTEGHRSREFRRLMIKMLGKKYVPIALHMLGGIQFGLFCKRSILAEVEHVSVADVTCGIGNVFHNKGAIGAFVQMKARQREVHQATEEATSKAKSLRMLFVTAHMAAHVKNFEARDADFWRITGELEAQAPARFLPRRSPDQESTGMLLLDSMDRIFVCGDLNYRVDLPREMTEYSVGQMAKLFESNDKDAELKMEQLRFELLRHDQLLSTIAERRAFPGFAEGKITFPPTFKFDKHTGQYDTSHKQRIPAWTDRVLFKPKGTRVLEYDSVQHAQHSDHRPVYCTFRVSMEGRSVPPKRQKKPKKKKRPKRVDL